VPFQNRSLSAPAAAAADFAFGPLLIFACFRTIVVIVVSIGADARIGLLFARVGQAGVACGNAALFVFVADFVASAKQSVVFAFRNIQSVAFLIFFIAQLFAITELAVVRARIVQAFAGIIAFIARLRAVAKNTIIVAGGGCALALGIGFVAAFFTIAKLPVVIARGGAVGTMTSLIADFGPIAKHAVIAFGVYSAPTLDRVFSKPGGIGQGKAGCVFGRNHLGQVHALDFEGARRRSCREVNFDGGRSAYKKVVSNGRSQVGPIDLSVVDVVV
jgi:hypothetical protein